MPRKKKTERLEKKNVMIYIEAELFRFAKDELPNLNLSKIATDAIIRQIRFALELLAAQDPLTWDPKRFKFHNYLQQRRRILVSNGQEEDLEDQQAIMDEVDMELQQQNIPKQEF